MTRFGNNPHDQLEDAVVSRLRSEGLIRPRREGQALALAGAALSLIGIGGLLATGVATDAWRQAPASESLGTVYVVGLYAGPKYRKPSVEENKLRLREYAEWASAYQTGPTKVLRGGEVNEAIARFGQSDSPDAKLVGMFTIRARSAQDAVAAARSTPHLRHGGVVVVYPTPYVGSSRVDLQACKLEYSIVSPK